MDQATSRVYGVPNRPEATGTVRPARLHSSPGPPVQHTRPPAQSARPAGWSGPPNPNRLRRSWDHGGRRQIPESRLPAFTEWTLRARDPYERAGTEPYRPGSHP
ncbi:AAA ATPase [Streptomyces sp. NBRC 110611]|nr:AAA ATPase [Streptomyces sp. NBRC 110611]